MNQNNTNYTTLAYKGDVNVRLIIRDKIFDITNHNNGTANLRKAFVKFLTGYADKTIDTPEYLDLRYTRDNVERPTAPETWQWEQVINAQIPLTGKNWTYEESVANYVANFTAVIPSDTLMKDIKEDDPGIYRLFLYAKDAQGTKIDLAYMNVEASALLRITAGAQASISWSMQLLDYPI